MNDMNDNKLPSLFSLIILVLLISTMFAALTGEDNPRSFSELLSYISSFEDVNLNWLLEGMQYLPVPDGWIGEIVSYFYGICSFFVTIVNGLINVITFLFSLSRWIVG